MLNEKQNYADYRSQTMVLCGSFNDVLVDSLLLSGSTDIVFRVFTITGELYNGNGYLI
jgi:hypothetical protein